MTGLYKITKFININVNFAVMASATFKYEGENVITE